ncbi:MAG: shikimate dehydrogenase, partial [Dehalococcoidales bacterium]|nr:shikimate dehydrogenase [Dehalococcoidales bacterium]
MTNREITGKTQICAVIGSPIEHTMSPAMHNAAFEKLGLDYAYVSFRVAPEDLPDALDGIRALNIRGFNVAIPHKVPVIPLLDGLDAAAEKIGAVNTVINHAGSLRGYNTDGEGFLRSLRARGVEPKGSNIVVIGAGGASRAITYVLARRGARLTLLNRSLPAAEEIAELIEDDLHLEVRVRALHDDWLEEALKDADILVNTTSLGMSPAVDASPVPAGLLREKLIVCDIGYNPTVTKLLA